MAITAEYIQNLVFYGEQSEKNKNELMDWFLIIMEEVNDNKGGHIVSASANGASFYQVANMTNHEYASCLRAAIKMLNAGVKYRGVSYGQIL